MESRNLKIVGILCILISLCASGVMLFMPEVHAKIQEKRREEAMSGLELVSYFTEKAQEEADEFSDQLRIKLPEGVEAQEVVIVQDYLSETVTIEIPGIEEGYFYNEPIIGRIENVDDITFEEVKNKGIVDVCLAGVYEVTTRSEEGFLYVNFVDPHELYDYVVVIDAGHGGKAPGAVNGEIYEKDITLGIVQQLKGLLDQDETVHAYYTRLDDSNPGFEERVRLANDSNANLFISVHMNSLDSDTATHGSQVLYDEKKKEELGSKRFAKICLEELTSVLGTKDLGLVKGNDIYIIRNSNVPVALVEGGFISNSEEAEKFLTEEYQKRCAQAIYYSINRAKQEGF